MAYAAYTTRAFVVNGYDRTGSDRSIKLFTEDAGMLYARAIGVRDEKSKLRYALQPFSFSRVSLVRGKAEWRLIGAESEENVFFSASDRAARGALLRAVRLLSRLVRGEEAHPRLFKIFRDGMFHLARDPRDECESALALRLLSALGYISDQTLAVIPKADTLKEAALLLEDIPNGLSSAGRHIDRALTASQL